MELVKGTCQYEGCTEHTTKKQDRHIRKFCLRHRYSNLSRYNGGQPFISTSGYRMVYPEGSTSAVPEHRYVMEQQLGRPLNKGENVHHINGDRSDNRPENLELWDRTQPAGQRVADKIAFYKAFLEQHGYTVTEAA